MRYVYHINREFAFYSNLIKINETVQLICDCCQSPSTGCYVAQAGCSAEQGTHKSVEANNVVYYKGASYVFFCLHCCSCCCNDFYHGMV